MNAAADAHDALLAWCSETGSGPFGAFVASARHLRLDARAAARALSMLGHVEFDRAAGRYAACPTVLTAIPGLPGRMLLTGARPYGLLEQLAAAAADADLDIDVAREGAPQFGRGPSTVYVDADAAGAAVFCAAAGVTWEPMASARIAALLPDVRLAAATVASRPDDRTLAARVDEDTLAVRWDHVHQDRGRPGLWRHVGPHGQASMILWPSDDSEPRLVLDPDCAPYLLERPQAPDADPLVSYHAGHRLLKVDAAAPLPVLHARAACLCSGRLPLRRDVAPGVAHEHFVNVDAFCAEAILTSLGVSA